MKLKNEAKRLAKVGLIEIRIWNIENVKEDGTDAREAYKPPRGVGVVSEKALKGQALSHSVEYGTAQTP